MKKINTLKMLCHCALGCICATNAMAQSTGSGLYRIADERATGLVPGQDYVIYNTASTGSSNDRTGFIFANSSNGLGLTKKKPVNTDFLTAEYVWTVETGTDGKYYLKSKSLNKYVGPNGGTNNTSGVNLIIQEWTSATTNKAGNVGSENTDGTTITNLNNITTDNRVWVIGNVAGTSNTWWNGNATSFVTTAYAHPYAFYEATELTEDDKVTVTYTYTMDGKTLGSEEVEEFHGIAPINGPANLPVYVTGTFPATIEAGKTDYTVETTYNNQMPFQVSTDETSVYYRISFNVIDSKGTTPYRWYADTSNQGKEENTTYNGLTLATEQNWKWKFVGDWFNGFNIMTQSGKYLTANSTTVNQAGTSLTDAPDASKSYFLLQRYTDKFNNTGWRFALEGSSLKLAHTSYRALNIDTWAADDYNGAHLIFEEMGDFQTMLNELRAAKDEAKGFLDMTHVGTPVADATERTELQAKVTEIEGLDDNTVSYQTYKPLPEALTTKLTAYLACTNLLMPESGKAYTIVFRPANKETGTYRYVNFTGTGLQAVAMANKDSEIPESGVFVVRSWTDGSTTKYAMVPAYGNVYGKYLAHNNIYNGWATDNRTEFTVTSVLSATNKSCITDQSDKNLFGYVFFTFTKRNDGKSGSTMMVINEGTGSYDATSAPFLKQQTNGTYTSALIVKEVENYPSSVQLRGVDNIEGITAIGTFSAPYAAIVPEGVTAHYISSIGNKAEATAIAEGEAIPAGQGVLLTGEAGRVTMVPATTETRATISGNLLGNTAGGAKALTHGSDYILTSGTLPNGNQGVAFYPISATDLTVSANKAYLHTEGTNAPALVLSFGEGETDGVKGIDDVKGKQAPVFDLQGRRVQKTAKGLYIQNGKKFMVK